MYKYIIKNVSSKYNKINMYKNNIYYGNSVFSVINNESVIHNLYIGEIFRGNNNGNLLLFQTENIIKNSNPNVNKFSLLAHELPNGNLINFYKSHNYNINYSLSNKYYDDGIDIYSLIYMYKYIN
jgi:hypothetical protein